MKLFLGFFKTTNILPLDIRDLNVSFSKRCRVYCSHSKFEMLLVDRHGFQDLGVDFLGFNIDDIHFLSNTLKSRLCAKSSNIRSYETMSLFSNSLEVDIFVKLHILSMNSEDFETANLIRNTNIDLSIESSESSKSRVKRVRPVGSSNNNNMSSSFETVHKSQ